MTTARCATRRSASARAAAVTVINWYLSSRTSRCSRVSPRRLASCSTLATPFDLGLASKRAWASDRVFSMVAPNVSSALASTATTTGPSSSHAVRSTSMLGGPRNSSIRTFASGSTHQSRSGPMSLQEWSASEISDGRSGAASSHARAHSFALRPSFQCLCLSLGGAWRCHSSSVAKRRPLLRITPGECGRSEVDIAIHPCRQTEFISSRSPGNLNCGR